MFPVVPEVPASYVVPAGRCDPLPVVPVSDRPALYVVPVDPDVPVPEVSTSAQVRDAYASYRDHLDKS
jgi:hypothetical protein